MLNRISILILTWNRANDLLELLINLGQQEHLDEAVEEILILNNASTDPYNEVEAYINTNPQLKVKYILSETNTGVDGGRNRLMQIAKGDLLLTIDDDMAFTKPNDLKKLSELFNKPLFKENNTGVITFRVIYYDTKELQVTAFTHKKYEKYASTPNFLTSYFAGGANIMKREMLLKTGLYPDNFHYGMEEYDLSYRILNAGYTIGYDNEVTIEHKESPLGRQPNYKKLQMQWINKSRVAWRYLPFKYFLTTAISWSFQYLRGCRGHFGTFFSSIWQILKIPFTEKRSTVNENTLAYLHKVEARLKY